MPRSASVGVGDLARPKRPRPRSTDTPPASCYPLRMTLEELRPNAAVRGILPDALAMCDDDA